MKILLSKITYLMLATSLLAACATSMYEADTLNAGLTKVNKPIGMDELWIKPGFDPESYSKIIFSDVVMEYKPVRGGATTLSARNGPFIIEQKDRDKLQTLVTGAFAEEFQQFKRYQAAEIAGPETMKLETRIQDVVSNVPPLSISRSDVYLAEVGRAALVIVLKDSSTGDTLLRGIDRRAAENYSSSELKRSNSVENWVAVKRLARTWARGLRHEIDDMRNGDLAVK